MSLFTTQAYRKKLYLTISPYYEITHHRSISTQEHHQHQLLALQ
jgi:hypothetical protein